MLVAKNSALHCLRLCEWRGECAEACHNRYEYESIVE